MADKMMIHKIIPYVDYNECGLNGLTNQNSIKVPKVEWPTNNKKIL